MKKILIVEDETLIALDLKNRLERHGYQVLPVAGSAAEAVESAIKNRPDIILMNIVLKGEKTGIEAACVINESYTVQILFITGNARFLNDEIFKKIPIYKILRKPPFESVLLDTVEKLIRLSEIREIKS
jgi:CheY-like chemotaxis protein